MDINEFDNFKSTLQKAFFELDNRYYFDLYNQYKISEIEHPDRQIEFNIGIGITCNKTK